MTYYESPNLLSPGSFNNPAAAVSNGVFLLVSDSNNSRVQVLTDNTWTAFGVHGAGIGEFSYPRGVAIDFNNNFYIADTGNRRVQQFDSFHNFRMAFGAPGPSNGQFNSPVDIGIDETGNIYVLDSVNSNVQVFSSNGTFLRSWGGLSGPQGFYVSPSGFVYVADTGSNSVKKYSSEGSLLTAWNALSPADVSVDANGDVYVLTQNLIQRSQDGINSANLDLSAASIALSNPMSISFNPSGNFIICDSGNNRVLEIANCIIISPTSSTTTTAEGITTRATTAMIMSTTSTFPTSTIVTTTSTTVNPVGTSTVLTTIDNTTSLVIITPEKYNANVYNISFSYAFSGTGVPFPIGTVSFSATVPPYELIYFIVSYPCSWNVTTLYKSINETTVYTPFVMDPDGTGFVLLGEKGIDLVHNCAINLTIRDNGRGDSNPLAGTIGDPFVMGANATGNSTQTAPQVYNTTTPTTVNSSSNTTTTTATTTTCSRKLWLYFKKI